MRGSPTRYELMRLRRRLERVLKGAELLSRKRRALVSELFRIAAPASDAREKIEQRADAAYAGLLRAQAAQGHASLWALGMPSREVELEVRATSLWGVPAAEITDRSRVRRSPAERGTAPGSTGPAAVEAASHFEVLTELLLDAASRDLLIRRLSAALSTTSRQVNLLERRVAPGLASEIARVRSVLEEREREDRTRFKRLLGRRRSERRSV
jgi:V/A-type H+-transporting ATPase subunit D